MLLLCAQDTRTQIPVLQRRIRFGGRLKGITAGGKGPGSEKIVEIIIIVLIISGAAVLVILLLCFCGHIYRHFRERHRNAMAHSPRNVATADSAGNEVTDFSPYKMQREYDMHRGFLKHLACSSAEER